MRQIILATATGTRTQDARQEVRLPLIDRLERALDNGVDSDKFELTAIALLESRYPSISPVEAGKGMGRDADICTEALAEVSGDPTSSDVIQESPRPRKAHLS